MKKLHFDYRIDIQYSSPADVCDFIIKCFPCTDARQKAEKIRMEIIPECTWSTGRDGFGNTYIYGKLDREYDSVSICTSGDVIIKQVMFEEKADEEQIELFRQPYGLNQPGNNLKQYFEELSLAKYENIYERALLIMHRVHYDYAYKAGAVKINMTAEEAWNTGKGDCQDYVHIFIALCQMADIPARYVTGMTMGEGTNHAWAEVLYRGEWVGMDPVNDVLISDAHIKTGHGRDAADCWINDGNMHGHGIQRQKISVSVTKIE